MRRPRRNHAPVFKAKRPSPRWRARKKLTHLAERFDIQAHQIAQWWSHLVARAVEVFAAAEDRRAAAPVEVKALHAKTGQQGLELDVFVQRARAASWLRRREGVPNVWHRNPYLK